MVSRHTFPCDIRLIDTLFSFHCAQTCGHIENRNKRFIEAYANFRVEDVKMDNTIAECSDIYSGSMKDNFFQSLDFIKVLRQIGWRTVFLGFPKRRYQASVLSFAPRGILGYDDLFPCYQVLYGPCMQAIGRDHDPEVLDSLLKDLCFSLRRYGAVSLSVRTPFPFPTGYEVFRKNGFAREITQGEYSVIIDLEKDLDTLWKEMKRFARRDVKTAVEKGVEVRDVETEMELRQFYRIYAETGDRRGFRPYPYHLFEALWNQLEPNGKVKFFIALWKKKPIAGILNTFNNEESVPYIACSMSNLWKLHPNHLLFWHSIKWSREVAGSSIFKLYHVPHKREKVNGIDYYTFKTCFGGYLVEECTFYQKIISPAKFRIFQTLSDKLPKWHFAKSGIESIKKVLAHRH